jgi:hypothetical protein
MYGPPHPTPQRSVRRCLRCCVVTRESTLPGHHLGLVVGAIKSARRRSRRRRAGCWQLRHDECGGPDTPRPAAVRQRAALHRRSIRRYAAHWNVRRRPPAPRDGQDCRRTPAPLCRRRPAALQKQSPIERVGRHMLAAAHEMSMAVRHAAMAAMTRRWLGNSRSP